jgi:hypothetical protein
MQSSTNPGSIQSSTKHCTNELYVTLGAMGLIISALGSSSKINIMASWVYSSGN